MSEKDIINCENLRKNPTVSASFAKRVRKIKG